MRAYKLLTIATAAENDWQLPQELPTGETFSLTGKQTYGFLDLHSGFFTHIAHVENDVNVLGTEIESLPRAARKDKLREAEEKKWDEEYYM